MTQRRRRLSALLPAVPMLVLLPVGTLAVTFEVRDAVSQFRALKHHGEAIGWILPEDEGAPDPSTFDHYQGVARYPGSGTPVLYVTQLDDDDPVLPGAPDKGGYLLIAQMSTRPRSGERLRSNLQVRGLDTIETSPPASDTYVRSIRFDGSVLVDGQPLPAYKHPGGMAIVDDVLLMALDQRQHSDAPIGQIVLFDLRPDREDPHPIAALPVDHPIDNLAVIRRVDGSLLLWVNGGGGQVTRFYGFSSGDIRSPNLSLTLLQNWSPQAPGALVNDVDAACEGNDWPEDTDAHQSATFLRQTDGALFLLMTRNTIAPSLGCDVADLFRVDQTIGFRLTRVASKHMFCSYDRTGTICGFGAAAGGYVSPSGELLLYSVPHDDQDGFDPDFVRMAEFRHRHVSTEDSPLRLPTVDAGGQYAVDEGGTITLSGSGRPPADRPWVELYDDDDLEDRSIVIDYDDRNLLELENFAFLDQFGDKTSAVRWRSPIGLDVELYDDHDFHDRYIVLKGTGHTEAIENLATQTVVTGVVEHPDRDEGDGIEFGDKTSSARWVGAPPPATVSFAWDLDEDGTFDDASSASPIFDRTLDDDVVTVRLRVTAADGASNVASSVVTVTNVAPRIESATLRDSLGNVIGAGNAIAFVGLPVALDVRFTDPGRADTQTALVDWGDGPPDGTFNAFSDAHGGRVGRLQDTHAFGAAGAYDIVTTITDDDGGATPVTLEVEVLSPIDAIGGIADLLTDLIAAATNPNVAAALRSARDELVGNHGGTPPTNGALDKLEAGDPVGAITKLQSALAFLLLAESAGAGDLSAIEDLVGLVAEAIATQTFHEAEAAVAPPSRGDARTLATIAGLIANGHQRLGTQDYRGACDKFRQATAKAVNLI